MHSALRLFVLLGIALSLAACAASPSPEASASPSIAAAASEPPLVGAECDITPIPFDPDNIDLTGAWAGDDGGIYYLRQEGSIVWWNGMSGRSLSPENLGRQWNNVARGEISGTTINVEWADVPRGQILGEGTLTLEIGHDGTGYVQIVKVSDTGSEFDGVTWTPCTPAGDSPVGTYVCSEPGIPDVTERWNVREDGTITLASGETGEVLGTARWSLDNGGRVVVIDDGAITWFSFQGDRIFTGSWSCTRGS